MAVAVFCNNNEEYEVIETAVDEYAREHECLFPVRRFTSPEEFRKEIARHSYRIVILADEDIVNQELAVCTRDRSELCQIIWIGEDKRFGLSSYRVWAANFIVKPATREDIWYSLRRCEERLKWETHRMDVRYADVPLGKAASFGERGSRR